MITLDFFPYKLNFKYPFRLAHTERTGTDNVYILLRQEKYYGWGETVFIPYYPEKLEHFQTFTSKIQLPENCDSPDNFAQKLKTDFQHLNFCIAGLDIAYHNLYCHIHHMSIGDLYKIKGTPKATSFTIGISENEEMRKKINENLDKNYFKLKVSESEISRIITTFMETTDHPFTIDANQGFTDRQKALKWSFKLADLGVDYMEQPFHKDDLESHAWLKKQSPIPIIADESFQTYSDLEKTYKYFDGVNLKLMKCGGVYEGWKCLNRAQEMELKTIIGCMSESTIACNAALHLAPLADWTDLDGPLLITNDLFKTVTAPDKIIPKLANN